MAQSVDCPFLGFSKLICGIGGFQLCLTFWAGFSSFEGWRSVMFCSGQHFTNCFSFPNVTIFPSRLWQNQTTHIYPMNIKSSRQGHIFYSLIRGFIILIADMNASTAEVTAFQGEMRPSLLCTTTLSLKNQLAVSWGRRCPMNLIYSGSSHRRLLKFLSGIHHR